MESANKAWPPTATVKENIADKHISDTHGLKTRQVRMPNETELAREVTLQLNRHKRAHTHTPGHRLHSFSQGLRWTWGHRQCLATATNCRIGEIVIRETGREDFLACEKKEGKLEGM